MTYFDLPLEELKSYQPPRYEPEDFDLFWENTLSEVRRFPLEAIFKATDFGLQTIDTFDVSFNGYGKQVIKAWLLLPKKN